MLAHPPFHLGTVHEHEGFPQVLAAAAHAPSSVIDVAVVVPFGAGLVPLWTLRLGLG